MHTEKSLSQALLEVEDDIVHRRGEDIRSLFDAQIAEAGSHLARAARLMVGAVAPDFSLTSTSSRTVSLSNLLDRGPVILTFYRGSWCNFCDMTLKIWQKFVPEVEAKGATLYAISPETPEKGREFKNAVGLTYELLSDANNTVSDAYGLTFTLPFSAQNKLIELGTDVGSRNQSGKWDVPVTATFIVGTDQRIIFADCSPDYRQRADPALVLSFF